MKNPIILIALVLIMSLLACQSSKHVEPNVESLAKSDQYIEVDMKY
ncbi:hypothetical protein [Sphingobacterium hotanense]|nr:hypothetical protein [Sphingobacterium hotanense]